MEDRKENIRRIAEVAALMNDAGVIVITSFISLYIRSLRCTRGHWLERMIEVFIDTPLKPVRHVIKRTI